MPDLDHHDDARHEDGDTSPRVVILVAGSGAQVRVLSLPRGTAPGLQFEHDRVRWRITGRRSRSGVLYAEPDLT